MKLPPVAQAQATRCKMQRLLLQKVVIDGWCCIRFAHSSNVHIGRPICKKNYNERIENQFKNVLNGFKNALQTSRIDLKTFLNNFNIHFRRF